MESEINGDQFNSILSNSFSLYQWFQSLHFKDRFKKKLKVEKNEKRKNFINNLLRKNKAISKRRKEEKTSK